MNGSFILGFDARRSREISRLLCFILLVIIYGCANSQEPENLSNGELFDSNYGRIEVVHFNLLDEKTSCVPTSAFKQNRAYSYFLDSTDVSVCLVHHILWDGNIVRNDFSDCKTPFLSKPREQTIDSLKSIFDSIANSYDVNASEFSQWIYENQPFSKNYSKVNFGASGQLKQLDYGDLTIDDKVAVNLNYNYDSGEFTPVNVDNRIRWVWMARNNTDFSFTTFLDNELDSLKYESNSVSRLSVQDRIKLLKLNIAFEKVIDEAIARSEMDIVRDSSNGRLIQYRQNRVNWSRVCQSSSLSIPQCRGTVKSKLHSYVQDIYHIRKCADAPGYVINAANERSYTHLGLMSKYASELCGSGGNSAVDKLRIIAGGNIFRSGDFLFIGRDVLERIKESNEEQKWLGAQSSSNNHIEKAILNAAFNNSDSKSIVWVGTEDRRERSYSAEPFYNGLKRQPIYHIDLFFHPFGFKSKSKEYWILLGVPTCYTGVNGCDTVFKEMRSWVLDSKENVLKQLESVLPKDYKVRFLEVPLGIHFGKHLGEIVVDKYVSPTNGYVENINGQLRYFFPYDSDQLFNADQESLKFCREESIKLLEQESIDVKVVLAKYDQGAKLRCMSKILRRN